VGSAVSLEHRRPSPLGTQLEVQAELVEVTGHKLFFGFIAYGPGAGDDGVVGAGTIQRVLVDADQFMARARENTN
jgi:fluoroacetyl-CoA thioesterase